MILNVLKVSIEPNDRIEHDVLGERSGLPPRAVIRIGTDLRIEASPDVLLRLAEVCTVAERELLAALADYANNDKAPDTLRPEGT
jgi:hypothetical protein